MNVRLGQKPLIEALKRAKLITGGKHPAVPILDTVKITAQVGGVLLEATNLQEWIQIWVFGETSSTGEICGNLAALLALLEARKGAGEIVLTCEAENILRVHLPGATLQIPSFPAKEFPLWPAGKDPRVLLHLPGQTLLQGLRRVIPAASRGDEDRPVMTGVLFHVEGGQLTLVATNGKRMAVAAAQTVERGEARVVIPAHSLGTLSKILAKTRDLDVMAQETGDGVYVVWTTENTTLAIRTIQGVFPDYRRVIPKKKDCTGSWVGPKAELEDALKTLAAITPKPGKGKNPERMVLECGEGEIRATLTLPDVGQTSQEIRGTYNGEPLEVAYDTASLLEGVQGAPEGDIQIHFQGPDRATLITIPGDEEGYRYVQMPCRRE